MTIDNENKKWTIVGFDPGLTIGLSIIDLDGNIITSESHKEINKADITNIIIKYGNPIIITTDVSKPPKMVQKITSLFNAQLITPEHDLTIKYKRKIVSEHPQIKNKEFIINDDHKRDSLSAALHLFKQYKPKFNSIKRKTDEYNITIDEFNNIKKLYLQGHNISDTIEETLNPPINTPKIIKDKTKKPKKEIQYSSPNPLKQKIANQKRQINQLQNNNNILKQENKKLKKRLTKINKRMKKQEKEYNNNILHEKKVQSKLNIIKRLQIQYNEEKDKRIKLEEQINAIENLKKIQKNSHNKPVKIIDNFTKEGIKESSNYWQIKQNDIIYLRNCKGGGSQTARILTNMNIKAVITNDTMSHTAKEVFDKNKVPIFNSNDVNLEVIDEFGIIDMNILNNMIKEWQKNNQINIINNEENKLENMLNEYKAKRKYGRE